jgi:phosphoribosylformylglycinamidine synthase
MALGSGGCEIHLEKAPLKYAGLAPWEIFLSEAQERMTLSVPPSKIDAFLDLARRREVEATVLGTFNDSGRLECRYDGKLIASLDMDFLHDGVPKMHLKAKLTPQTPKSESIEASADLKADLKAVLASPNVCSKETFVRMYDHEVQAQSVLKQFQGVQHDGPGDAAVLRPVPGSNRGLAIACGICPKYSDLDAYWMTAAAIDEAVRNLICVGAQLGTIAGLDNFCWPEPIQSDKTPDGEFKLAQLVRCCKALRDVCVAYGIPLISGKDSMKNDYKIGDTKISIPPTILFTAAAIMDDVTKSVSMDVKRPGDVVYLLGETKNEMGGSEYLAIKGQLGANVPKLDLQAARELYAALSNAISCGLVASCHDCSDGGLGVALAESAFAGGYGMDLDIRDIAVDNAEIALFSESQSRFVATVHSENAAAFENALKGNPMLRLGKVTTETEFTVRAHGDAAINIPLAELKEAWQKPLRW